jgi:hypothetical protein
MDRGARNRIMNRRAAKESAVFLLLALLVVLAGCHRGAGGVPPLSPREELGGDNAVSAAEMEWLPPVVATELPMEEAGASPADNAVLDNTATGAPEAIPVVASPPREAKEADLAISPADDAAQLAAPPSAGAKPGGSGITEPTATPTVRKPKPSAALHQATPVETRVVSSPGWAKNPEELVYRVDFIGITMGYARFRYVGKVTIAGKSAYHLNVRAWTSGILSYIFPINETIDYYLDAETIAPIRQEFTQREKEKDDVLPAVRGDPETGGHDPFRL